MNGLFLRLSISLFLVKTAALVDYDLPTYSRIVVVVASKQTVGWLSVQPCWAKTSAGLFQTPI